MKKHKLKCSLKERRSGMGRGGGGVAAGLPRRYQCWVRSTQSSVSSSCSLLTQRGSPPCEKGNIITPRPSHNGRPLTNSHLILPLRSPCPNLGSFSGRASRLRRYSKKKEKRIQYVRWWKIEDKKNKITQAHTCSLEKCFNYIQKNAANKGGN